MKNRDVDVAAVIFDGIQTSRREKER